MFRRWFKTKTTPTGPMWRHGQETAERDIHVHGLDFAHTFAAYTLELDPNSWYAMSYRSRATEGD